MCTDLLCLSLFSSCNELVWEVSQCPLYWQRDNSWVFGVYSWDCICEAVTFCFSPGQEPHPPSTARALASGTRQKIYCFPSGATVEAKHLEVFCAGGQMIYHNYRLEVIEDSDSFAKLVESLPMARTGAPKPIKHDATPIWCFIPKPKAFFEFAWIEKRYVSWPRHMYCAYTGQIILCLKTSLI